MDAHMGQKGTRLVHTDDLSGNCPPNDPQLAAGAAAVPSDVMQAPDLLRAAATHDSPKLEITTHAPQEVEIAAAGLDWIIHGQQNAVQVEGQGSIKRPRSRSGGRKPRVVPSSDGLYSDVDDEPDYVPGQQVTGKGSKRVRSLPIDSGPSAGSLQLDSEEEVEVKPKKKKAKLALQGSMKAGFAGGFNKTNAIASKGGSGLKRCVSASSGAVAQGTATTINAASHTVTGAGRKRAVTTGSFKSNTSAPIRSTLAATATASAAPVAAKAVMNATPPYAAHMDMQPLAVLHTYEGLTELEASKPTHSAQIPSGGAPPPASAECVSGNIDCAAVAKPGVESSPPALMADTVDRWTSLRVSSVPLHCAIGAPAAVRDCDGEIAREPQLGSKVRKGNSSGGLGSKRKTSNTGRIAMALCSAAGIDAEALHSPGGEEGRLRVRRKITSHAGSQSAADQTFDNASAAEMEQSGRGIERKASSKATMPAAAASMAAANVVEAREGDSAVGMNHKAFPKVTLQTAAVMEVAAVSKQAAIKAEVGHSTVSDPSDAMAENEAGKGTGFQHVQPHQANVSLADQAHLVSSTGGQRKTSSDGVTTKDDASGAVGQAVGGGEGVKRKHSSKGKAKAAAAASAAEQGDSGQNGQGVKRKASSKAKAAARGNLARLEARTEAVEVGDGSRKMDVIAAVTAAAPLKTRAARLGGLARPGGALGKPLAALCANTNGPSVAAGEEGCSRQMGSGANIISAGKFHVAGLRRPAGTFKAPRMERKLKQQDETC